MGEVVVGKGVKRLQRLQWPKGLKGVGVMGTVIGPVCVD